MVATTLPCLFLTDRNRFQLYSKILKFDHFEIHTSESFSQNSLNLELVTESPVKGLAFCSCDLISVSKPSMVVNLPPRLPCSHSNSRDGIDRTAVSDYTNTHV